jgi:hypothetical protein
LKAKFTISFAMFLLISYCMSLLVGSPEFWWMNQEFSLVDTIPPPFSMLMYQRGMNNMHVGGCSSEM